MPDAEKLYNGIASKIPGAEKSQLFGKPCYKINGKAFVCFFKNCMVFKLSGASHKDALALDGSELFDPSGKKRPMKEWVQVPYDYSASWKKYAKSAFDYVSDE